MRHNCLTFDGTLISGARDWKLAESSSGQTSICVLRQDALRIHTISFYPGVLMCLRGTISGGHIPLGHSIIKKTKEINRTILNNKQYQDLLKNAANIFMLQKLDSSCSHLAT